MAQSAAWAEQAYQRLVDARQTEGWKSPDQRQAEQQLRDRDADRRSLAARIKRRLPQVF